MDMNFSSSGLSDWKRLLMEEASPSPERQARDLFTC